MNGRIADVLRRIGSSDSISWPVFWMTFVAASIGNFLTNPTGLPIQARMVALIVGQVVFWLPLLLSGEFMRRGRAPSLPWLVAGALLLGLLLRALAVSAIVESATEIVSVPWPLRFITSLFNIAPVFGWTAYIVSIMRERRRQIATLEAVRADLERSVDLVSTGVTQRYEETVDRVRTRLTAELGALDAKDARGSLETLQRTASEVVRPMSITLAKWLPVLDFPLAKAEPERIPWLHVVDRAASGKPYRPIVIAILMCMPMLGGVILDVRAFIGAAATFVTLLVVYWLGNWAVRPMFRAAASVVRIAALVVIACGAAAIAGVVAWVTAVNTSFAVASGVGIAIAATVVSLGVAVITALGRDRDDVIGQLEASSEEIKRNLVRWRQTQWFQQKGLSRALHGPVQTAVNAAAIRLDDALERGEVNADLVEQVRTDLLRTLDVLHSPATTVVPLVLGIDRIVGTWEGICTLDVEIEPAVELILDDDPALRSCLLDILTDLVGPAVTHGKATSIDTRLAFDLETNVLQLTMQSNGSGGGESGAGSRGLPTRLLDDCCLEWCRTATDAGPLVTVLLPAP